MGVSNSQKYNISDHAKMRIQTRFNVPKTKIQGWVDRFMAKATFFKEDEDNDKIQTYKMDDVLMVLNTEDYIVVTAYSYNPFNKTNGLSDDILQRLQPSLNRIISEEKVNLRNDLDGLMLDLQMEYQAFQAHPKSEKMFKEYLLGIDLINERIENSELLIKNINGLKK